ncbi:Stk1 family PASTA domain-containing Ser/Thr kinase [Pueribacillus sp. YX66]|uniref:Stk1 family PASTA domain-containing Ser/Thr kinase n=1 Tax=Pueribacillus sp. YX66 TaxID=3229242 RepID=UPI00358CDED6
MINKRLNERYKLLEVIGEGGMAIVYRAEDLILDRTVAVKVLRSEFSNDDEFILRFRREAESATSLSHPNIVNIYDVGEEEQVYYIVMEYVKGKTLKEYIREAAPLAIEEALSIFTKILSAIRHAHDNHIIHRDIKPHNILITDSGQVKVTDFGIAMAMTSATITHTKSVLGSVHYLSPEQAKGSISTEKSDIYSLGVVLYEMVTGIVPFSGESPVTVALKHLQEDYTSPRLLNDQIPQSVEHIINKAMAKEPKQRYDNVAQLQSDISIALEPTVEHQNLHQHFDDEETKVLAPVTPIKEQLPKQAPEEEKPKKDKKKKKRRRFFIIIALIILSLGVITAVTIASLFNAKDVTVPDVTGLTYEEAVKELQDRNLVPVKEEEHSNEVEEDRIIRQSPSPDSMVKERSEVTIVVSVGKEKKVIENYVGMSKNNVERLISNLDFEDVEWIEVKSDEPAGTILEQTPEEGEEVVIEETTLILKYSNGIQTVTIDNLIGMTKKAAESYLKDKGLKVDISEQYSDKVDKNHVISQAPEPFVEVKKGSTVKLVISKGEDPSTKEQPLTFEVSQPIEIHEDSEIIIRYQDATTKNGVAVQERASNTKTYTFPLTIAPHGTASFQIYINGKEHKNKTYTYREVQNME